jgi:hypothetical protein
LPCLWKCAFLGVTRGTAATSSLLLAEYGGLNRIKYPVGCSEEEKGVCRIN